MKFLFVAPRFHPNLFPLLDGLVHQGHAVTFCATSYGQTEKYTGIEMILLKPSFLTKKLSKRWQKKGNQYLEKKLIFWFMPNKRQIKSIITNAQPDVIILRDRNFLSLFFYIFKGKKIKSLLYNQAPIFQTKESLLKRMIKKLCGPFFPKRRITPCQYSQYPLENMKYIKDKNAFFVPFVSRGFAKKRDYIKGDVVNIFDCGKYREYKNHLCLLKSIDLIVNDRKISNFHVTILGQASDDKEKQYLNNLKIFVKERHIERYFTFLTQIPYDEVPNYYLKNDVFVLPSREEVASVSVLDAMSFGLATISTSKNGTADYILPNFNGNIFETDNHVDLADKICNY